MGSDSAADGKSVRMHLGRAWKGSQEVDLAAGNHWGQNHLGATKKVSGLANSSTFD